MTKVVHCKRAPYDVLIDRTTKWGNPFIVGVDGTRAEVIEKHKQWLPQQPKLMAQIWQLKDKVLGCHCDPLACHGDFLAELADAAENRS